jgi:hypothetical protein
MDTDIRTAPIISPSPDDDEDLIVINVDSGTTITLYGNEMSF